MQNLLKHNYINSGTTILFFFVLLLVNHFFGFTGPFGFDDLEYARLGHLLFKGEPDWGHTFTYRFGIVIPTAFFHSIFDVSDHISAIYPLIIATGILYLIKVVFLMMSIELFLPVVYYLLVPGLFFIVIRSEPTFP